MHIVCQACRVVGVQVDEAYKRRMMGEGRSYQERQRERVQFPYCGKDIARVSLDNHLQTHHGVGRGGAGQTENKVGGGDNPRTFGMTFPVKAVPRPCPIDGCNGRAEMRTAMQVNLCHRHVRDNMVILE